MVWPMTTKNYRVYQLLEPISRNQTDRDQSPLSSPLDEDGPGGFDECWRRKYGRANAYFETITHITLPQSVGDSPKAVLHSSPCGKS